MTGERRTLIEQAESDQSEFVDLHKWLKDNAWIGLTWAVHWIAFRGISWEHLDADAYEASLEEAARQIIGRLAQLESVLPTGAPLKAAKGVWEGQEHFPDDHSAELLWGDASLDIADYDRGKYVLDLTGSHDPYGATGALIGRCKSWVRISVATKLIRKHWAPTPQSDENSKSHLRGSAEVEREIARIAEACPPEISPLPQEKMLFILRRTMPGITKGQCNQNYNTQKGRGPRPGRSREETRKFTQEFIQKMTGEEFPN